MDFSSFLGINEIETEGKRKVNKRHGSLNDCEVKEWEINPKTVYHDTCKFYLPCVCTAPQKNA